MPSDLPEPATSQEEKIAHLERSFAELSDVVARQDRALDQMEHRIAMLMQREAEREADGGGSVFLGDEKPPHW